MKTKFIKSVKKAEEGILNLVKQVDAFIVPDFAHGSKIEGVIGMPIHMYKNKRKRK